MLVSELYNNIAYNTDNIDAPDFADALQYINAAIDYLSTKLIAAKDPLLTNSMDISNGLPVPSNFVQFVPANGYPVYHMSGTFYTTTGATVKKVKYSYMLPHVTALADTVPFPDFYTSLVVETASELINKRTPGISIAQDSAVLTELFNTLQAAKA